MTPFWQETYIKYIIHQIMTIEGRHKRKYKKKKISEKSFNFSGINHANI